MKTVLLIGYHFLNDSEIGSKRLRGLYSNLPLFGWKPVVLTRALTDKPFFETLSDVYPVPYQHPFLKLKKIMNIPDNKGIISEISERYIPINSARKKHRFQKLMIRSTEFLSFPDLSSHWTNAAIKQADKIIHNHHIDIILSSYGPSACHSVGSYLSKSYSIPWVADYRDLWCDNPGYSYSPMRHCIESAYEKKMVTSADYITSVSVPLVKNLEHRFKKNKIMCIPNGFDETIIKRGKQSENGFSFVYTGRITPIFRDIEPLFRVLYRLLTEGLIEWDDIKIHFYGDNDNWLSELVHSYSLQNCTYLHGQVSYTESLLAQRNAQVLLLLTWNDPKQEGVITGKLFEYLASGRPILAIGHYLDTEVKGLLNKTRTGDQVFSDEMLRVFIMKAYKEYKSSGVVAYTGINEEIMKYSHREMTRKFVGIFEEIKR